MLRAILVGLDGSPFSYAALQFAAGWAQRMNARLLALGIVDEPTIRRPEPVPLGAGYYKQHLDETRLREAQERVVKFLKECEAVCSREQVQCQTLTDIGEPWEQIVLESQLCDVIILGKQTYFHFETQEEPCDTLCRVLRNTPRPVVAVPEHLPESQKILIAYDGSVQAARALQLFTLLELPQGRETLVCSVDRDAAQAKRWAETAGRFLAQHGVQFSLHPITSSQRPDQVLLEEINKHQAGLVVMGAYGKPILREFFLGSTTTSLLKNAPVPIFLYH